jgi:N-acetylneuraminic acid mutarotase
VEVVSAHAGVVNGNKWYVFGGSNSDCKPNNHLLRLNLDTYEWTRLEQKGEAPAPRESAFLAFVEKNWLLLYGGISTCEVEIYNTFHFYNLDTRNWSTCEGAYQYQLYARLDPALCHFRDRLYLFGGTYRTINNEERYLDDFYEIAVAPPARNQTARVQVKRLAAPRVPEGRSGHSLVALGENHLVLVGGENTCSQLREGTRFEDVSLVDNMWLFDTRSGVWGRLELGRSFRFRSMASCLAHNDKLYLFGGLHSYSAVLKDFVEIAINPRDLA